MAIAVQTSLEVIKNKTFTPAANDGSAQAIPNIFGNRRRFSHEIFAVVGGGLRLVEISAVTGVGFVSALVPAGLPDDFWAVHFRDLVAGALLTSLLLSHTNSYDQRELTSFHRAGTAGGLTGLALAAVLALNVLAGAATLPFLLWGGLWLALSVVAIAGARLCVAQTFGTMMRQGSVRDAVAVIGAGTLADRLVDHFIATGSSRRGQTAPVEVIGIFDDRRSRLAEGCRPAAGSLDDLLALGQNGAFDRVIVAIPWSAEGRLAEICHRLKALSIDVALCPDGAAFGVRQPMHVGDLAVLPIVTRPLRTWASFVKRAEDIVLSSLALVFFGPLMVFIAIAVKLDSAGPALFCQSRHGFNNREIKVYKFRTMRVETTDQSGGQQTTRDDKRITRLGRFLRRTSLDELPQLLNVLKGDMSMVGPRPHPIGMRTQHQLCHEIVREYAHRHRVKPGITGWAQVNGYRGATGEATHLINRVEYDLFYIDNWSVLFDLRILLKTFSALATENAF